MGNTLIIVLMAVLLVGCRSGGGDVEETAPAGAESPEAAVEQLFGRLVEGDFEAAAGLGVPGQAALAALAEGATPAEVLAALEDDGGAVSANFWSGFAQGAGSALEGNPVVESLGTSIESGVEFTLVSVTAPSGVEQRLVTREVDGHRVDIFASFGAVLAGRLISPVDLLLGSSTAESGKVLQSLRDVVPSLLVAAADQRLSPQAAQEILQLIELITRVG